METEYFKPIDLRENFKFPVYLEGITGFQSTLSVDLVAPYLYYRLEYISGQDLLNICLNHQQDKTFLISLINDALEWFKRFGYIKLDEYYLLFNGDSHAGNITYNQGIYHLIDNQTDFLVLTNKIERVYIGFIVLLQRLKLLDESFIKKLNVPEDIKENRMFDDLSLEKISDISDQHVLESRDQIYLDRLYRNKHSNSLLSSLLIESPQFYKNLFSEQWYQLLTSDFIKSKVYWEKNQGQLKCLIPNDSL